MLKGPASVLYGAGQPGGTVNLITKLPQDINFSRGTVQFGSFGLDRYEVDSTGRINDDGSLLYRVSGSYTNSDSFRNFVFYERTFISPSVTWVLDDCASLTWQGEFAYDRRMFDSGLATNNNNPGQFPRNTFLGEPANDFQHFHDYRQSLLYNHRLNDCWTLFAGGYSLFNDYPSSATIPNFPGPFGPFPPNATTFARIRQNNSPAYENYQSMIINLAGQFDALCVHHNLVLGTELGWQTSPNFAGARSTPSFDPLFIDAANPVYTDPNPFLVSISQSSFFQHRYGFYLQDLVELNDYWSAMAGVRFDHVDTHLNSTNTILLPPAFGGGVFNSIRDQTNNIVTPRVGLVYSPYPDALSFYGTYTQAFDPQGGLVILVPPGTPLNPTLANSFEGGFKSNLTDYLTLNCAAFYVDRSNQLVLDNDPFGPFGVKAVPVGLRSKGVEMNLYGQLSQRWSMIFNWTFCDTHLSDPAPGSSYNGKRNRNAPLYNSNIWTRYDLIQDCRQTFGVALGMVQVGERLGDFQSPLLLPGYDRWDAGVYYRRGRADVGLYLENIFNAHYYTGSISQFQIYPGAPTTVRAQATLLF